MLVIPAIFIWERRGDVRVEQKNPDSNGMRAVGKD